MSETLSRRAVLTGAVRGTLPEEETFDVVVVGSGAAGLAAALEARKAGGRSHRAGKNGQYRRQLRHQSGPCGRPRHPAAKRSRHRRQPRTHVQRPYEGHKNQSPAQNCVAHWKTPLPPGSGQSMSSAFTGAGAWNTTTATRSGAAWRLPIRVRAL